MGDPVVDNLILDLLAWVANRDRSYQETIDAWRTSCPRLPVWEEANDQGLVAFEVVDGLQLVRLTQRGHKLLEQRVVKALSSSFRAPYKLSRSTVDRGNS